MDPLNAVIELYKKGDDQAVIKTLEADKSLGKLFWQTVEQSPSLPRENLPFYLSIKLDATPSWEFCPTMRSFILAVWEKQYKELEVAFTHKSIKEFALHCENFLKQNPRNHSPLIRQFIFDKKSFINIEKINDEFYFFSNNLLINFRNCIAGILPTKQRQTDLLFADVVRGRELPKVIRSYRTLAQRVLKTPVPLATAIVSLHVSLEGDSLPVSQQILEQFPQLFSQLAETRLVEKLREKINQEWPELAHTALSACATYLSDELFGLLFIQSQYRAPLSEAYKTTVHDLTEMYPRIFTVADYWEHFFFDAQYQGDLSKCLTALASDQPLLKRFATECPPVIFAKASAEDIALTVRLLQIQLSHEDFVSAIHCQKPPTQTGIYLSRPAAVEVGVSLKEITKNKDPKAFDRLVEALGDQANVILAPMFALNENYPPEKTSIFCGSNRSVQTISLIRYCAKCHPSNLETLFFVPYSSFNSILAKVDETQAFSQEIAIDPEIPTDFKIRLRAYTFREVTKNGINSQIVRGIQLLQVMCASDRSVDFLKTIKSIEFLRVTFLSALDDCLDVEDIEDPELLIGLLDFMLTMRDDIQIARFCRLLFKHAENHFEKVAIALSHSSLEVINFLLESKKEVVLSCIQSQGGEDNLSQELQWALLPFLSPACVRNRVASASPQTLSQALDKKYYVDFDHLRIDLDYDQSKGENVPLELALQVSGAMPDYKLPPPERSEDEIAELRKMFREMFPENENDTEEHQANIEYLIDLAPMEDELTWIVRTSIARFFHSIPLLDLALASSQQHLQKFLLDFAPLMHESQLRVIVPNISTNAMQVFISESDLLMTKDIMLCASNAQKIAILNVAPLEKFYLPNWEKEKKAILKNLASELDEDEEEKTPFQMIGPFIGYTNVQIGQTRINNLAKALQESNSSPELVELLNAQLPAVLNRVKAIAKDIEDVLDQIKTAQAKQEASTPEEFLDHQTGKLMENPVIVPDADGIRVDRSTVLRWKQEVVDGVVGYKSAYTRTVYKLDEYKPDDVLRERIQNAALNDS